MPGPVALVGAGEFLPAMAAVDAELLAASGRSRPRVAILPTASWPDGEAVFLCQPGKVPEGMIFVPYGPPTCHLYGGETDGTGMPTTKGWEVDVELIAPDPDRS